MLRVGKVSVGMTALSNSKLKNSRYKYPPKTTNQVRLFSPDQPTHFIVPNEIYNEFFDSLVITLSKHNPLDMNKT